MREKTSNTWLSIGAYARTYGITRNTVYKWLDAQLLEVYTFQGLVRIRNLQPADHQPQSHAVPKTGLNTC